ncbi:MAG TPA: MFS transporter [Streptosporangiaceae bacterium]
MTSDAAPVPTVTADQEGHPPTERALRVAVATLSVAQLMLLIDATIVNIALPSIQASMRMPGPTLEWVVTGYSLPFGGLLLLGGRAGDMLGRRRVFTGGLLVFTVASLLGGLAPTSWWLLACRAAQGIGAAAAYPGTLALITATIPDGPARHRALGAFNAIGSAGGAIGFLAGGLITSYLSWRWVMFVNVPIGAFIVLAAPRVLRETEHHRDRFDLTGAVTVTLGLTFIVYGLITGAASQAGQAHWTDPAVLASLAGGGALVAAFVLVERRAAHPLVPLRIFADRSRSGGYVVAILLNTAMFGILFFMTLFLQRIWHYTPLHTAVVYVPLSGLLVAGAWASGRLVRRLGVRSLLVAGLAISAAGMALLARIGDDGGYVTAMLVPTVLIYSGIGLTTVPLTLTAVSRVAVAESGLAAGLFSAARQVGGATGLAVTGTVTWAAVAAASAYGRRGAAPLPGLRFTAHALTAGIERGFAFCAAATAAAMLIAAVTNPRTAANPADRPG